LYAYWIVFSLLHFSLQGGGKARVAGEDDAEGNDADEGWGPDGEGDPAEDDHGEGDEDGEAATIPSAQKGKQAAGKKREREIDAEADNDTKRTKV
jgi:hypothetical protein